jgi:hypothetical protein
MREKINSCLHVGFVDNFIFLHKFLSLNYGKITALSQVIRAIT